MNHMILTERTFEQGLEALREQDPDLAMILSDWDSPPFWIHPQGFPGLVLAILSQQVSLESARAAYSKLESRLGTVAPGKFLDLGEADLRQIGFSGQKASYVRELALRIDQGLIELEQLDRLEDDLVVQQLVQLRGIGRWTANCYLLFSLRRPDAWPHGDLALARAIQERRRLPELPGWDALDRIAEAWRPWRAVAARILWHDYLCKRGRS